MHSKPSVFAKTLAKKRAKARNRAVGTDPKRISLNLMDVLMAMDKLAERVKTLETEANLRRDY